MSVQDLVKQAEGLLKQDHYEQAVSTLRQAVSLAEDRKDKDLKKCQQKLTRAIDAWAEDVNCRGDDLFKRKNYKEAIHYYAESLNIVQEANNPAKFQNYQGELNKAIEGLAQDINNQGDQLMAEEKYEAAVKVYAESVEMMQRAGNQKKLENFQQELQSAYAALGLQVAESSTELVEGKQWEDAIKKFEEALAIATKAGETKASARIEAMRNEVYEQWAKEINIAGVNFFKEKKYDQALPLYSKAVELAEKSQNESIIAQYQGELQKTFKGMAGNISSIGAKLLKDGQFMNSIDIYTRALEIAKQSKDAKLTTTYKKDLDAVLVKYAQSIRSQADGLIQKGELPKAAQLWKDCWEMARKQVAPKFLKETEDGYFKTCEKWAASDELKAEVLASEGKYEEALAMLETALQAVQEINHEDLESGLKARITKIGGDWVAAVKKKADKEEKRGKTQDALKLFDQAISIAEKGGDEKKIKDLRRERDRLLRNSQPRTDASTA